MKSKDALNAFIKAGVDWSSILQGGGIGAGIGGVGAGLAENFSSNVPMGETPDAKRKRILNKALMGAGLGGLAGGAFGAIKDNIPGFSNPGAGATTAGGGATTAGSKIPEKPSVTSGVTHALTDNHAGTILGGGRGIYKGIKNELAMPEKFTLEQGKLGLSTIGDGNISGESGKELTKAIDKMKNGPDFAFATDEARKRFDDLKEQAKGAFKKSPFELGRENAIKDIAKVTTNSSLNRTFQNELLAKQLPNWGEFMSGQNPGQTGPPSMADLDTNRLTAIRDAITKSNVAGSDDSRMITQKAKTILNNHYDNTESFSDRFYRKGYPGMAETMGKVDKGLGHIPGVGSVDTYAPAVRKATKSLGRVGFRGGATALGGFGLDTLFGNMSNSYNNVMNAPQMREINPKDLLQKNNVNPQDLVEKAKAVQDLYNRGSTPLMP